MRRRPSREMEELLGLFRLGLRWAEPEAGAANEARVPGSWEPKIPRALTAGWW